jgi:hypothetical protein
MTAGELAGEIAKTLDGNDEAMDYIQGLKREKGPDGGNLYTYNGIGLDKMEKEKLVALLNRIHQERTRLNTERLQKQMESIRQAQQATNAASRAAAGSVRAVRPPVQPPQPAPSVQQPPRPPPQPPRLPRR